MIYLEINREIEDDFQVLNDNFLPVNGLLISNFNISLINPDGDEVANVTGGNTVTIDEIGNGFYRVKFTPNVLGNWTLVIKNNTYFADGKGENYTCVSSLGGETLRDWVERILGLSQQNYKVTNQRYDKYTNLIYSIIKTYRTPEDCNNEINPIATYEMTSTWDKRGHLMGYKVIEI